MIVERLRHFFHRNGDMRQRVQIAESRKRVAEMADEQSDLLRQACAQNAEQVDVLAEFVREMQRRRS